MVAFIVTNERFYYVIEGRPQAGRSSYLKGASRDSFVDNVEDATKYFSPESAFKVLEELNSRGRYHYLTINDKTRHKVMKSAMEQGISFLGAKYRILKIFPQEVQE